MLLVVEMIGQLCFQDPFGDTFLQVLELAVFAEQLLGFHPEFHDFSKGRSILLGVFLSLAIALPSCEQDTCLCQF